MIIRFDRSLLPAAPDLMHEEALWQQGVHWVCGIDEAGRGAWAGPVAAGAVILPQEGKPGSSLVDRLSGVRDSKQMTPVQREKWAAVIRSEASAWGVGLASHEEIDRLGIVPATRLAVRRALDALRLAPEYLLVDYLELPEILLPQSALVKGDARSLSIASASILAKTARDALMQELEEMYPGYGFARHKGYGTSIHLAALKRLGPCPIHRLSFAPLREPTA